MNDAQKKALINKLGAASNGAFDARYSVANRKWFVAKIIEALLAQGVTDANIEKKANDIIAAAGAALKARITAGFSTASLPQKWALYDQLKSRTQIIYGMIAMYPAFLDPANAGYFDFILERRFRSIQRMAFYVNPNPTRNVFAYPSSNPPQPMKVNKDADAFWTGVNSGTLPFILTASGKTDPVTADENLFKKNAGTNRNLFACDPVATTLHMDALRAAKDPGKLLKALVAVGDHYLKIDNPLGHFANYPDGQRLVGVTSAAVTAGANVEIPLGKVGRILTFSKTPLTPALLTTDAFIPVQGTFFTIVLGDDRESFLIDGGVNPVTKKIKVSKLQKSYGVGAKVYVLKRTLPAAVTQPYHFITDTRPTNALFEQLTVAAADLQVGDHVYVVNHPLYGIYYPTGAWGGEHSFISEIDSRDSTTAFRTSLKVEGHGLNDTLLGMGNEMLEWVNTVLSIVQAITPIHLNNLKANGRKSTAKMNFIQRKEGGVDINVFEYNMPYTYTVFEHGKKTPNPMTSGFVLKERAADPSVFQLFNANGKDSTIIPTTPAQDVFLIVGFIGTTFATEQFTASKWGVGYFNTQTATLETQPLFEKDNKTPKLLTFDDLAKAKPFYLTDDNGIAYVTRPRVDFSAAYQTFLKNNGAI
jgi:hypothetical protein